MKPFDYALSERPEVARLLPDSYRTVLEVGCAKGGFRSNLDPSAEVWGIEPNANAAQLAKAAGYKILVGIYNTVANQCPDNYFDLVVCNDVIEHMSDHEKFLEEIKLKLKPGGAIVGSVPNVRYVGNMFKLVFKRDWEYVDQGILDRTHLRFFTAKSLMRTFQSHGYEVDHLAGINSDLGRQLNLRQIGKNSLLLMAIALSLGNFQDFRFMQYGFRLRHKTAS
jgi:2-polyprenyl-3-methyl-5-hydroxy-6-metoxy-1,4-benzoquinol methylase